MTNTDSLTRTLFIHDNLPVLRGLDSESVDLIATDPPFNKNVKDFSGMVDAGDGKGKRKVSYKDTWTWKNDVQGEWTESILRDHPNLHAVIRAANAASGEDMGAYLCYLGVRVLEMQRILKATGSLYLHIDHTAGAWAKAMLDAIFGRKQFRNEIVWCYSWPRNTRREYGRQHDTLLYYTKSTQWTFNPDEIRQPYSEASEGRDDYAANVSAFGSAVVLDGRGKLPQDWLVIPPLRPNAKERTGYPTQKPLALTSASSRLAASLVTSCLTPSVGVQPPASPQSVWAGSGLGLTTRKKPETSFWLAFRKKRSFLAVRHHGIAQSISGKLRPSVLTMAQPPPPNSCW